MSGTHPQWIATIFLSMASVALVQPIPTHSLFARTDTMRFIKSKVNLRHGVSRQALTLPFPLLLLPSRVPIRKTPKKNLIEGNSSLRIDFVGIEIEQDIIFGLIERSLQYSSQNFVGTLPKVTPMWGVPHAGQSKKKIPENDSRAPNSTFPGHRMVSCQIT
ncbi:hypothetical protein BJV77DRAFT_960428 [Russula vinacea]|nr:hypothetical protein BJV77DRAFT_960428 [Russula vinacea]